MEINSSPIPGDDSTSQWPSRSDHGTDTSERNKGNNARPRETNRLNLNDIFKTRQFTRFFTLKPKTDSNLTKLNMFKVDKEISSKIGICEKISEDFRNKGWTIQVKSHEQGEKLKLLTHLVGEPVSVESHESHNTSQGVITCNLLKKYSEADIVEGLEDQGVIGCRRIIKNMKTPNPEPTSTLILTFNKSSPPDRIIIRTGLIERVRLYIPLPRRCYNCHKYGHSGAKCRRPIAVCGRCGQDVSTNHSTKTCTNNMKCIHCNGNHPVSDRNCPTYLIEKEILAIKTKEHLTYSEARAKVLPMFPRPNKTYSSVTSDNPLNKENISNANNESHEETDKNNSVDESNANMEISNNRPLGSKRALQTNEQQENENAKRKKENTYIPNLNQKYTLSHQISFELMSDEEEDVEETRPPDGEQLRDKEKDVNNFEKINQQKEQILNKLRKMEEENRKEGGSPNPYKGE